MELAYLLLAIVTVASIANVCLVIRLTRIMSEVFSKPDYRTDDYYSTF